MWIVLLHFNYWLQLQNISKIFPTRIAIIHRRQSLYNVLTWVTLFSLNLVITVSVIHRKMRNFYSGRFIGTAKFLRIQKVVHWFANILNCNTMIYGNYILGVKRDFHMGKTFAWPTTSFHKEGRFGPIEQNAQIFKSVQLYIKQTKRFTPQWSHFIYWI